MNMFVGGSTMFILIWVFVASLIIGVGILPALYLRWCRCRAYTRDDFKCYLVNNDGKEYYEVKLRNLYPFYQKLETKDELKTMNDVKEFTDELINMRQLSIENRKRKNNQNES